jgi:hypothetical protein
MQAYNKRTMRPKYTTFAEFRVARAKTQRAYNQHKREERKVARDTMLSRIERLEKNFAELEKTVAEMQAVIARFMQ